MRAKEQTMNKEKGKSWSQECSPIGISLAAKLKAAFMCKGQRRPDRLLRACPFGRRNETGLRHLLKFLETSGHGKCKSFRQDSMNQI